MWSDEEVRRRLAALEPRRVPRRATTRMAAVAIVLRFERAADPEALFIRRSKNPADPWSGHMAFPGGHENDEDVTLEDTAVRETHEEVGLDLRALAEPLGRIHDVQAIARSKRIDMVIVPFVFLLRAQAELVPDPSEVDEALWIPLGPLARGEVDAVRPYLYEGREVELPAFRVGEQVIWGLTHRMLTLLFEALRG